MAALMVVPAGVTFNVMDDNNGEIVAAFPTASAAAKYVNGGIQPTDTTYQTAMAEAKREYDAWMTVTDGEVETLATSEE